MTVIDTLPNGPGHPTGPEAANGPGARATGPLGLVRRHPLLSFFVLANAMSWLAWLPYILSLNGLGVWDFRFPDVMGSGQIAGVLPGAYLGPIASAFFVTLVADGREGLRRWVGRLWRWRVRPRWYAVTLLGVPAAMILTGFVFSGGEIQAPSLMALGLYLPLLLAQMVTTGLAEEPGWRDFALPRLQRRLGGLRAAMVLGPVWALWHMPLFLSDWGGYPDAHWTHPVAFTVFCVSFNVVMSWVFNRTGESLPLSMLMHVSVNNFASVLWIEMFPSMGADVAMPAMAAASVVAAAVLLVRTRGTLGYVPATPLPRDAA